ncbi:hydrogenase maturation protease [Dehalogenimonas formicexedens]|uniref:Hydrogenase maturation protease n=1 Tax=Dehalogenimonas formicexedens TaxID=1839801 RepID=A0A1P8F7H9_9CHLR|nr:hydrogenase maturation protease [Dehalogenimonas formicexedens]APV44434.1 hydrogenase maturation protease [Dehalogenimonas formicexedens]
MQDTSHQFAGRPVPFPVLILGVGNILLSDEGVGVRVVEELKKRPLPEGVEVVDGATRAMELIDIIRGREKVIIIDALDAEAEPGAVFKFGVEQLVETRKMSVSVHDIGVHEALFLLNLTAELPGDIVFYGIQPGSLELHEGLSGPVEAAAGKVLELVLQDLRNIAPTGELNA